jgi:hypothetical protein
MYEIYLIEYFPTAQLNIVENSATMQQPQPPGQHNRSRQGGVANTNGRSLNISHYNEVDMVRSLFHRSSISLNRALIRYFFLSLFCLGKSR